MTIDEKETVKKMRSYGLSYHEIAEVLQVKQSAVSNYCLRNGIKPSEDTTKKKYKVCPYCHQIFMVGAQKNKTFCSDKCRSLYWQSERRNEKAMRQESTNSHATQNRLDFSRKKSDEWCEDETLEINHSTSVSPGKEVT